MQLNVPVLIQSESFKQNIFDSTLNVLNVMRIVNALQNGIYVAWGKRMIGSLNYLGAT